MGNKAVGCNIVELLELLPGQAADEMVESRMEDVVVGKFRQGTRRTGLESVG